ncbi:hypothetical protein F7725_000067, partial [Dissostichus mawsoni]
RNRQRPAQRREARGITELACKEHHEESSVPADMVLAALETLRRETEGIESNEETVEVQTRGLIPADDQPGPTKAHRKAVIDSENEEYLQQQTAWMKAGRPSWYGSEKTTMNKAEKEEQELQVYYSI